MAGNLESLAPYPLRIEGMVDYKVMNFEEAVSLDPAPKRLRLPM
jgi:hypothetical protein